MDAIDHVAIVGAGFSGTLLAINLARLKGPRATLIERRDTHGRGVAYSTTYREHLLNVRAGNMSAYPDDPGHFAQWLAARGEGDGTTFAPRITYGDYLAEQLDATQREEPGRIELLHDAAVGAQLNGKVRIALQSGDTIEADAAVLAHGNLPPVDPPALRDSHLPPDLYAADPWASDIAAGLADDDTVLIVGSGLTMVDVVLLLEARGFRGKIVALSRRGLGPRAHAAPGPPPPIERAPAGNGSSLIAQVRDRAEAIGWRAAIDELRPFTQGMWLGAGEEAQRRFLRHARPWWDVHRHRIAPEIAATIDRLIDEGRLTLAGGKLERSVASDDGVEVTWRPRGEDASRELVVRRIVNCTGPQGDLRRTHDPLLLELMAAGAIRPDAHNLGIDVTGEAETITADGRVNDRLYALGPMTKGTFWEIVAVPDIRVQVWALAQRLAGAA